MPASAISNSASKSKTTAVILGNAGAKAGQTLLPRLKLLAMAAVIIAIAYNGALRQGYGPFHKENSMTSTGTYKIQIPAKSDDSCDQLLANGSFVTKDIWKPHGCIMHNYTTKETKLCLRTAAATTNDVTRIVLVGDSRMRYLTTRILQLLGVSEDVRREFSYFNRSSYLSHIKDLLFQLDYFAEKKMGKEKAISLVKDLKENPPTLLVAGAVLHFIVDYKEKSREEGIPAYETGIKSFDEEVKSLPPKTTILYRLTEPFSRETRKTYRRNDDIDLYNAVALKVFNNSRVKLWHSSYSIARQRLWDYPDGTHASNTTMMYDIQMMLNLVCNRHMTSLPSNTCCTENPVKKSPSSKSFSAVNQSPNSKSIYTLAVILLVTFICVVNSARPMLQRILKRGQHREREASVSGAEDQLSIVASKSEDILKQQLEGSTPHMTFRVKDLSEQQKAESLNVVWSLLKLFFILSYFILCDRFDFFEKASKAFSITHFVAPLLVGICVAAFSITTKRTGVEQILSRDITDEWKGWMQYVLLVYHASGASSSLPIYMFARVIVSSYLFLTGYGHFSRYWKTSNAGGFTRYCQVMYRFNFLTVLLCLVMDQPYMNYYFVVLVSFWYTVLHLVMALPPHLTESGLERTLTDFARGALKIAIVVLTIVLLSNFQVFEIVFGWKHLSGLFQLEGHPGVQEWRFRWMLDRFSVLYGMIFALMCQVWTRFWPNNSIGSRWPSTKWGTALLAVLSLSSFACYPLLLQTCDTKQACNNLHPYYTWIPILGYIFFRHHSSFFRAHFSVLFAFLGQISLELFISQYHILLASNTHSLLVLVPGQPIINTVVTGLVFLCSAHEISNITDALQPTLAPSDVKNMLRNVFVVGFGILLLVCWNSIG